jgi:uncharacterized membrane protein YkvA (DUF1232 family)
MADEDNSPKDIVPAGFSRDYSEADFWQKLKNYAMQAGAGVIELALQLFFAAADPATPRWARMTIIAALGYFVAPIDAVPDLIPGMGYVDDLGVLTAAVATVAASVTDGHRAKAKEKMRLFFGREG